MSYNLKKRMMVGLFFEEKLFKKDYPFKIYFSYILMNFKGSLVIH